MRVKEKHIIVATAFILIFVFSACREDTRTQDNAGVLSGESLSSAQGAILPEKRLLAFMEEQMNWNFIADKLYANWNSYSTAVPTDEMWELFYIGMTADRILQTWNVYVCNPDGSSYIKDAGSEAWLILFRDDVWAPDARAVCQAFRFDWAFPNWEPGWEISAEEVRGSFGSEIEWIADDAGPYYLYREKFFLPGYGAETEVTIRVFTNSDGTRLLSDKPILLQSDDHDFSDIDINVLDEPPLSRDKRSGLHWAVLNRYIEFLNLSEEEFLARTEYPRLVPTEYPPRYEDAQGVVYDFSGDKCSFVRIPAGRIFPDMGDGTITKDELMTIMNARVEWIHPYEDYGYGYAYYFEDCSVFIHSDSDMEIRGDDEIWIKIPQ
jgi:hypothetical protein